MEEKRRGEDRREREGLNSNKVYISGLIIEKVLFLIPFEIIELCQYSAHNQPQKKLPV